MDHHPICFPVHLEFIQRPVGTDLRRIVDHDFVVGVLPFELIGALRSSIYDSPVWRRLDAQVDGIRLVTDHIHKNLTTRVAGVADIQLRIGS